MNSSLHPNWDLLDPNFQSYKLSLKKGFIITTLDNEGIDRKSLPEGNFSKLNIYLFSLHNCLFQDRFNPCHLYYRTSSRKIKALIISSRKEAFSSGETVFTIPSKNSSDLSMIYNTSLVCLHDYVLLCTGSNHVYLLHTGNRSSDVLSLWKVVHEQTVDVLSKVGYLVDAVTTHTSDDKMQIDYILLSVHKSGDEKSKVYLDWLTLCKTEDAWSQIRHRRLSCDTFPDHVAFEGDAGSLTVRSTRPLIPLLDTANPDIKPQASKPQIAIETMEVEESNQDVHFTWVQSLPSIPEGDSTLLNILVKLSDKHKISDPKHGVSVVCKPCEEVEGDRIFYRLDLSVKTEERDIQLCSARLFAPVKANGTIWTYDRGTNSIDIALVKEEPGTWPRLFAYLDEERRLGVKYDDDSLLITSNDVPDEPMQSCFNVEQLEDVDMVHDEDEDAVLQRIDGTTLKAIVKAEMIGHQKLYTALTRFDPHSPDLCSHILCTRYDVDGLLWAPEISSTSWSHVATIQAFGYVLASKQNRRFVVSPPIDLSRSPCTPRFVAVSDITRHIYVYWQPTKSTFMELRKRKSDGDSSSSSTGSKVVHVAWQQVVVLPDNEEIIGFAAVTGEPYAACVVATRRSLYLVCLDEVEE
ncbi:unnamed protein product [Hymenolepis diminuta]|uniref:NudC domain-containing protein 1 n=1 Tax=Hymenolepis diminuta TaxID=6216 RepID=A0A564Z4F9_HYMDI|nr:unnamed protein product [Hymenolepis diminuta]